ncbi:transglutaminase-like domain-containing protein [Limibacter armeniacum]|uniref:transglutaminase-like domain-containing protein n=1 Tax=Limibacter armeniacum TaxID=466084 RepID=UPI002FE51F23
MKTGYINSLAIMCLLTGLFSCNLAFESRTPIQYRPQVEAALDKAGDNRDELEKALKKVPEEQLEGMSFLIAFMPQHDLDTLTADYLLENVALAYQARKEFDWAVKLPKVVFLNEVLPYATLNERRDNWRKDFYKRFAPMVKDAKDIREAIRIINHSIMEEVGVKYSTARPKPDQSPYESMECGLASCTGLSVLLTDAFRAVGIPSRIAGTPNWTTKEGNHNWNEVWVDGKWYFTEYYPSGGLNQGWFLPDAGQANPSKPENWIYASSYQKTDIHFPLVWDMDIEYVSAENVTSRYLELYQAQQLEEQMTKDGKVKIQLIMFRKKGCSMGDDRISVEVKAYHNSNLLYEGKTPSPEQDMNDYLTFYADQGSEIQLFYPTADDLMHSEKITLEKSQTIRLYYQ